MKWNVHDLERYIAAKEYIDTIVMPLVPIHVSNEDNALKSAKQNEVISIIANEIEKELSGRIMLLPNYYYLKTVEKDNEVNRLNQWIADIVEQPFHHQFFITADLTWKKHEKLIDSELLLLSGIQAVDIQSKEADNVISEQVSQIIELIRSYW